MEKLIKSTNGQWTLTKGETPDMPTPSNPSKGGDGVNEMAKEDDSDRKNQAQSAMPKKPTKGKGVRLKGGGHTMSGAVGEKMQQLREEGEMKTPSPDKMKEHVKEAAKVSRITASQGKTFNEREMLAELKDKGRRIKEAAARSKYFSKPGEKQEVVRRKKEDMEKCLLDYLEVLKKALEEDNNSEMLFSQLEAIVHHVQEIREVMKPSEDAPDWVDAKITEAAKQLSDVAHYIQGVKAAKK